MGWSVSYATRTLFNAIINGNRGYQAPYTADSASVSMEAQAMLDNHGPAVLASAPAVALEIKVVPQAHDFVHVAAESRMLPAFSLESTSGGWVPLGYSFDPPPSIPAIILPQAQWTTSVGDTQLTGLYSNPTGAIYSMADAMMPGLAYPGIITTEDNVTQSQGM